MSFRSRKDGSHFPVGGGKGKKQYVRGQSSESVNKVKHANLLGWGENGPEEYSATPGDYWNTPDDHVFETSNGEEMELWEYGYKYNEETGNDDYVPLKLIKAAPVTARDIRMYVKDTGEQ